MEEFQIYLEQYRFRHHDFYFLYPLILQEFIYALTHDRGLTRSIMFKNVGFEKPFSLIIVKRFITRIYQPNHLLIISANYSNQNPFFGHKKNVYFKIILEEVFSVILEIPFTLCFLASRKEANQKIEESKNIRSIHSIFTFLEDNLYHLNDVSNILIPYPIHLEILVQIIRYWVKDYYSLHFLRLFFFHEIFNLNRFIFLKNRFISILSKNNQRLFLFLYNSHICEYESIFVFLRNQSSHLRSTLFIRFLDRIYFYGKIEHLVAVVTSDFKTIRRFFKNPFMYYVRYQGKSILASKGKPILMKKWKYYLANLWQDRFYMWSQPRFHRKISKISIDFLGYLSSVRLNSSVVRSQMLESSYIIDNGIKKKFDTTVPILPLMGSLAKEKFCNVLGHPISKSVWSDLSDSDIFYLFWCIHRNISHYHSGSSKKKSLFRIKYILKLSCVRTLARKHKLTVRAFLNKIFGSKLLHDFFTTEEEQVLSFILSRYYTSRTCSYRGRIWYLDIICMNDKPDHSSTDLFSNHVYEKDL